MNEMRKIEMAKTAKVLISLYNKWPELLRRPCEIIATRYQLAELTDDQFKILYNLEGVVIHTTKRSFNWIQDRAKALGIYREQKPT